MIFQYFSKNGVPRLPTKYELFNEITGLNLSLEAEGNDFLQQVLSFSNVFTECFASDINSRTVFD